MGMSEYFNNQPSPHEIYEMMKGFQSWIEIDLDAIGHNIDEVRRRTHGEIIPCVKSNAYGHGVVACVAYMINKGIMKVLVAKLGEALQLCEAGLEVDVISLDPPFTQKQFDTVVDKDVIQTIYQEKPAEMLSEAAGRLGKEARVWVKVDTGLGRVGIRMSRAVEFIEWLHGLPSIKIDGIFSTMSEDADLDRKQVERLLEIEKALKEKGIKCGTKSIASSNAVFHKPYTYLDATRPGLMLFGFYPDEGDKGHGIELRQSLAWKARIEHVKTVEKGESLTYSRRFVAPKKMKVGTVHVGYYDGYPRGLTKKGKVKVNGEIRDVLGTVSVNHFLVDLSDTDLEPGDPIEVISREGENDALNVANLAGIMTYSLANQMHILTPRVYYENGVPVAVSKLKVVEE
jgi:alanine racemase